MKLTKSSVNQCINVKSWYDAIIWNLLNHQNMNGLKQLHIICSKTFIYCIQHAFITETQILAVGLKSGKFLKKLYFLFSWTLKSKKSSRVNSISRKCQKWYSLLDTLIKIQEAPIWRTMWGPCFGHKRAIFWPFLGKVYYGIHPELEIFKGSEGIFQKILLIFNTQFTVIKSTK